MPRRPRLRVAGIPLHITQRGVNRRATFIDTGDHLLHRELLTEIAAAHAIDVHAYALMSRCYFARPDPSSLL